MPHGLAHRAPAWASERALSAAGGSAAGSREPLPEALHVERVQCHQLSIASHDFHHHTDEAVKAQAGLEAELAKRDALVKALRVEVAKYKRDWQNIEGELALVQKDNINNQAKYLESVYQLNEEIQLLKSRIRDLESEQPPQSDLTRNDRLIIEGLRARVAQLKTELAAKCDANKTLEKENENFQLLLAGRVVAGGFSPEAGALGTPGTSGSPCSPGVRGTPGEPGALAFCDADGCRDCGRLRAVVAQLEAQLHALQRDNTALKSSLEKLVHRLLMHSRDVMDSVEESVSPGALLKFNSRMAAAAHARRASESATPLSLLPPALWSNVIFTNPITSTPERAPAVSAPLVCPVGTPSNYDDGYESEATHDTFSSPRHKTSLSFSSNCSLASDLELRFDVPKRIQTQTKLQKFRLAD